MPERFSEIDWDDLKFFLAVARAGSLRGAAETLGANHATVSRRLKTLEKGLSARLFDRMSDGLKLTQLGEELQPFALRIEGEVLAASRMVSGKDESPAGVIHLSVPPAMAATQLVDDLAEFSSLYPDIDLHMNLTNDYSDLARREADVALRVGHELVGDEENVVCRHVVRYALAIFCSPDYAARIEDNGGRGLVWIGWNEEAGATTAPWIKAGPFPHAKLRHRTMDASLQMSLASRGVGLCSLPCFMGDRHPGLVRAPFHRPQLDRSIWLLLHRDLRQTARIRALADFLVQRLQARKSAFLGGLEL
ncbi:LysR family transcriptional regulator [Rhodovibrionaceae bacterium A322]